MFQDQGAAGTAEHVLTEVNIFEVLHDVLCQDDKRGLLEEDAEEKALEEKPERDCTGDCQSSCVCVVPFISSSFLLRALGSLVFGC